jgi:spore germination protein GerM
MGRTMRHPALGAVALVTMVLVAACGGDGAGGGTPSPPAAPTTSAAPPGPTAPPGEQRALPVYYVADTPSGLRLYREFHRVATADPASDAVRELLAAPTGIDPDYRNLWPTGTSLRSPVTAAGGTITVDLSEDALDGSGLGTPAARAAVDQLVYTVQAALQSSDPVRILVGGEPVDELWGAVSTADPVPRADQYTVRSLVQIDAPADGAVVGRDVEVTGEAAVFEATVPWEVAADGVVVESGFANSAEGQRFSPFSFAVTLEPGEYVVRVTEDDPSGGEGRPPFTDDKRITVTG